MPPPSPFVRIATRADLPPIAALRRVAGDIADGDPAADTRRAFERDDTILVAADGGAVVGVAIGRCVTRPPIWRTRTVGEIPTFVLDGSPAGRASAPVLLTSMERSLRTRGAASLLARADVEGDPAAREALEERGFTPWMRTLEARAETLPLSVGCPAAIRDATPLDLPAVARAWLGMLGENAGHDPRFALHPDAPAHEVARLAAHLDDPSRVVVVAEEPAGRVVGIGAAEAAHRPRSIGGAPLPTITAAWVEPAYRRRGIATALAAEVAERVRARAAAAALRLHVVAKNEAALAFWTSLGATPREDLLERTAQ